MSRIASAIGVQEVLVGVMRVQACVRHLLLSALLSCFIFMTTYATRSRVLSALGKNRMGIVRPNDESDGFHASVWREASRHRIPPHLRRESNSDYIGMVGESKVGGKSDSQPSNSPLQLPVSFFELPGPSRPTTDTTMVDIPWFSYVHSTPSVFPSQPQRTRLREVILSASFPRTGSTWLYTLLEQASGKEGCSLYPEMASKNFFGGSGELDDVFGIFRTDSSRLPLTPEDNCIAKTHFPFYNTTADAAVRPSRLILLVRNPIDAVLSLRDYETKRAFRKSVKGPSSPRARRSAMILELEKRKASADDQTAIVQRAKLYMDWIRYWRVFISSLPTSIPVLILRYEDLCDSPGHTVQTVLAFANITRGPTLQPPPVCDTTRSGGHLSLLRMDTLEKVVEETRDAIAWHGFEDTVDALRVKLKSIEEKKAKLRTSSDRMQYKVSNAGAADSWF